MAVHPRLMIGAGIAIAGLGLVGAGAGATFTAQVSAHTTITTGGVGLSLNGETGSDVSLDVDGKTIGSHFKPITKDLLLKNTGTLDMASIYLSLTATGCTGGDSESLAKALHVKLTEVANHDDKGVHDNKVVHDDAVVFDGALCSFASGLDEAGVTPPPAHADVGSRLPHAPKADESIRYRIVIQPDDAEQGLPTAAQNTRTSVNLVFTGFDY